MTKAEDSAPVRPGDVIGGKYRIERVLGAGGMGVVVAARHVQLGQLVAVKFLLPEAARRPEIAGRFLREAHAAVRLRSEHVARVFDVGTTDPPAGSGGEGAPYLVMEYLEGSDLAAAVERGPLPIADAVGHVIQACDALQEAHGAGIVHRDIKPANLFLTRRPNGTALIKLLDFGISKMEAGEGEGRLTATSTVMGSPYYMSPEQLHAARNAEPRSDIWALGAVLYELLTGRTAFSGESLAEICTRVLATQPTPLRALRPEVPPGLEAVVLRCMEKQIDRRFGSVAELAAALGPFTAGPQAAPSAQGTPHALAPPVTHPGALGFAQGGSTAGPMTPHPGPPPMIPAGARPHGSTTMPTTTSAVWGPKAPEPAGQSKAGVVVALGVGLACAAALGVFLLVRTGGSRAPASDPPAPETAIAQPASAAPSSPAPPAPPAATAAPAPPPSSEPVAPAPAASAEVDAGVKPTGATPPRPRAAPRKRPRDDHESVRQ
jgi:serine/threonine-protein kinase